MKVAINNYEDSTLNLYEFKGKKFETPDFDIEGYISDILGYSLSNIEWFVFKEIIEHRIDYEKAD